MEIRLATDTDADAINDIYNHYVRTSPCTFHTDPLPFSERVAWLANRSDQHPVVVAEEGGVVVGWASLGVYRERPAYGNTAESSVYIHHGHHRKGIGRLLMAEIIRLAREAGFHTILAGATSSQVGSIRLHEELGFAKVAHFREVGHKFGEWHDVVFLQVMI